MLYVTRNSFPKSRVNWVREIHTKKYVGKLYEPVFVSVLLLIVVIFSTQVTNATEMMILT